MPISEIPIFSMLRTKMQWHQRRQRLLGENVSNADTPSFRPRDLAPPKFDGRTAPPASLALAQTSPPHIPGAVSSGTAQFPLERKSAYEVRRAGNAVNLEDEMLKPEGLDVARDPIATLVIVSALMALILGIVISLFQALTQIHEITLVFVPKILAIDAEISPKHDEAVAEVIGCVMWRRQIMA